MKTSHSISQESPTPARGKNFFEKAAENPCDGCPAPCCQLLLIPHPAPNTYMDLDYILYMLGFPTVRMMLNSDGQWHVLIEQPCRLFDQETGRCTVHDSAEKPKTCAFFNPYRCWYKQAFTSSNNSSGPICFDVEAFKAFLAHVRFDEHGSILEIPSWECTRDLVEKNQSSQKSKTIT